MKIMLLGSGELGKEVAISAQRLGHTVIAVDSYNDAPAMHVSNYRDVIDMLDGKALRESIETWRPDIIVPEIEAIRTEILYEYEDKGIQIVPSARAVHLTMNRDRIRDRAAELGIRTARFLYAESEDEFYAAAEQFPAGFVVKPVMSSSGKGQSVIEHPTREHIAIAWQIAINEMRGVRKKVIIEEFIKFDSELTLLTIKQKDGPTIFCEPIGHYQEHGDYQWSWQPFMTPSFKNFMIKNRAQEMAKVITDDLGGAGLFGVEFFVIDDDVIFSELSPRPHDTGMVTLRSQNCSEFYLHVKAILGLPIHPCDVECNGGASVVVLYTGDKIGEPIINGVSEAMSGANVDVRIFGKPITKPLRRMGVVLADTLDAAKIAAAKISISSHDRRLSPRK